MSTIPTVTSTSFVPATRNNNPSRDSNSNIMEARIQELERQIAIILREKEVARMINPAVHSGRNSALAVN